MSYDGLFLLSDPLSHLSTEHSASEAADIKATKTNILMMCGNSGATVWRNVNDSNPQNPSYKVDIPLISSPVLYNHHFT